jgi:hypothetical protein
VGWLSDGCAGRGEGVGGAPIAPAGEHVGDAGLGVRRFRFVRHKITDPLHRRLIRTYGNIPHYAGMSGKASETVRPFVPDCHLALVIAIHDLSGFRNARWRS